MSAVTSLIQRQMVDKYIWNCVLTKPKIFGMVAFKAYE